MTTASIDMRNSLHNIYAVNHKNEILNLKDLTTQPLSIVTGEFANTEAGSLLRHSATGQWEYFELPQDMKDTLSQDEQIIAHFNETINAECTGKSIMAVAVWAMKFNNFTYSFTNIGLDV